LVATLYYFSLFTLHKGTKYLSVYFYELLQSICRWDKDPEDPKPLLTMG